MTSARFRHPDVSDEVKIEGEVGTCIAVGASASRRIGHAVKVNMKLLEFRNLSEGILFQAEKKVRQKILERKWQGKGQRG